MTTYQLIDIWQPKWKNRTVLIAKHKVGLHNKILFSRTPSMPGEYYVSGETVKKHNITNNGKIDCYEVPLSELSPLEEGEKDCAN